MVAHLFKRIKEGAPWPTSTRSARMVFLEKGWGGAQDLTGARTYYLKACSIGQQFACFNAGNMQMQGIGGAVDDAGAFASYDKACGLDIGDGCYNAAFLIVKKRATGTAEKGFAHYKTRACELGVEKVC